MKFGLPSYTYVDVSEDSDWCVNVAARIPLSPCIMHIIAQIKVQDNIRLCQLQRLDIVVFVVLVTLGFAYKLVFIVSLFDPRFFALLSTKCRRFWIDAQHQKYFCNHRITIKHFIIVGYLNALFEKIFIPIHAVGNIKDKENRKKHSSSMN